MVVNSGEGPEYIPADSRRRREVGNEEEIPTSTTPKPPRESGSGRKVIKLVPKPRFTFAKYCGIIIVRGGLMIVPFVDICTSFWQKSSSLYGMEFLYADFR